MRLNKKDGRRRIYGSAERLFRAAPPPSSAKSFTVLYKRKIFSF
jgi:hypothetical protein